MTPQDTPIQAREFWIAELGESLTAYATEQEIKQFSSSKAIRRHVIEYTALQASQAEVEELKEKLAKAEDIAQFTMMYYNPKDTRFKTMVHNFMELTSEQKEKLIALSDAMRQLASISEQKEEAE